MSRATIEDVAERAGVSIKTVSRVINSERNVAKSTQTKVERAINELAYKPSQSARRLAGNRSFLIGLLYDNPSDNYVMSMQRGALKCLRPRNYDLIIHPCESDSKNLSDEVMALNRQTQLDGLILTPPISDNATLIQSLQQAKIPFAAIAPGELESDLVHVQTNDEEICARMTQYLASIGHQRIGFIKGHANHLALGRRYQGYLSGLKAAGLTSDPQLQAQGFNDFESGMKAARQLLSLRDRPSAIFACNDEMAVGVLKVAYEMGLRVPDQLSVVGFDDVPMAATNQPALSTIRQPTLEMAEIATELLLAAIGGNALRSSGSAAVESELVIRESSGPFRPS